MISIHALLAESDPEVIRNKTAFSVFLSTLSLRRATLLLMAHPVGRKFLSTLSLRRATNIFGGACQAWRDFYPRSPCGERPTDTKLDVSTMGISIHALLAESDANWFDLWGWAEYFYPRSPCGERPIADRYEMGIIRISIHALLAESDPPGFHIFRWSKDFYPRSPCGERHLTAYLGDMELSISIHALLAESDTDRQNL